MHQSQNQDYWEKNPGGPSVTKETKKRKIKKSKIMLTVAGKQSLITSMGSLGTCWTDLLEASWSDSNVLTK